MRLNSLVKAASPAVLVLALGTSAVMAAEITWTNQAGGDFSTAGNWSPNQVPLTADDVAYFTADNIATDAYTVTWSQDRITNECFRVTRGKVVLDLGGNTYVHNVGPDNSQIGTAGRADVTVTNGSIEAHGNVEFLHIFGEGTTVRVQNAYLQARYFNINASGAGSTLIVDGTNATAASWGYNQIGPSARGAVIVTNGGTVSFGPVYIGQGSSAYGQVIVSGTGSLFSFTSGSAIGGSPVAQGGGGGVLVRDGGMLLKTSTQDFTAWTNGTLALDGGVLAMIGGGNVLYCKGGVIEGSGIITGHVQNVSGFVRPGGTNQAGTLRILSGTYNNGSVSAASAGTLEIELGGMFSNEFDRVLVNGAVTCTGTLAVSFINGFSPTNGAAFDILDAGLFVGQFETVSLDDPSGGSLDTGFLYTSGEIRYSALAVMPAPTNVAATDGDFEDRVRVTWDPVLPATGYEVWRSLSADTGTAARVGATAETSYDDTTTAAGVTNYYWVKATNETLVSTFSGHDAGWRVTALPVPAVPTNVAASDGVYMYQGRVVVTWDPATNATAYEVWRGPTSDTGTAVRIGTPADTAFDDTTAIANVTNYYWVKSTNPAHTSDFSDYDTGWMAPVPPYEILWINPAGGDFHTPGNWDPHYVPNTNNQAVFSLTGTPYTVTWSRWATNAAFRVDEGTVTFDLGGNEYRIDVLKGQSTVGSASTTADLTVTNGILRTLGQNAGNKLHVRGAGTVMRMAADGQAIAMAYPHLWAGSAIVVNGSNALFDTLGYSYVYGDVLATNGGLYTAAAGTRSYGSASVRLHGGGGLHQVAFSVFEPDVEVYFGGGAEVRNAYVNAERRTPVEGRLSLDDAYYYDYYGLPGYVTVLALIGTNAVLEGDGTLGFGYLENGGTVRPGGTGRAGLLTIRGGVSNLIEGTLEIELGGSNSNDYDRIRAVTDPLRGPGTFSASGGILDVNLIDAYEPASGTTFDILDFVSAAGAFDVLNLPAVGRGVWDTSDLYVTGELKYFVPPPAGTLILLR